ncbi:DUF4388 domain-containing protein [Desulfuromonas acetoxidans]|uniref:DUF4388 domain-containing protein n=1 Tax=Desulfuromonas acetoxidans TaxID=891 RepID=UPI00292F845E|nr:DUF4388 domain-containing protein [Desulfuromonas acetoxidans]
MYRVTLDDSGRVNLPHRVLSSMKGRDLQVVSSSPQHILLAVEGERVPCMSAVLGSVAIADVLSFFNMFRQTGILYLDIPDGNRQVFFQDGEIIFATSQRVEENLGEILCEIGKLERSQLSQVRSELGPGDSLSKVLVKKNLVAARDLWLATRQQVETIVYNLFSCEEGSCYFAAGDLNRDDIVKLSMSTQNLIMEGLRRVDEKALYLRRLRSLESMLEYTGKDPAELSDEEKNVLGLTYSSPGQVGQLMTRSGLPEFDALRVLHQLVEKRFLKVNEARPEPVSEAFAELFEVFNGVLCLLCECVDAQNHGLIEDANRFMREAPHPMNYVFRGVRLNQDGSVSGGQLVKNLTGLEEGDQKKLLVDSLKELVYAECLSVRQVLGTQGSSDVIRRVQEIVARTRKLVE